MNVLVNWKTSLTVIIGAIAYLVAIFGIEVSQEVQSAIVVVVLFCVGLFAKDSGTGDQARQK